MIEFECKTNNKLLKILTEATKLNYNTLCKKLKEKQVLVDGKRINTNIDVFQGQKIVIFAQEKTFTKIYEDNNILVVLKPRGILSTSENINETSVNAFLNKTGKFYICHRLDVNTEGLLMFAKSKSVLNEVKNCFKNNEVEKYYYAEVFGKVDFKSKEIVCYLFKNAKTSMVKVVDKNFENAVKTITYVEKVKQNGEITLLKVKIIGGKTHQIRVALSSIGLKLVGDDKYGDYKLNKKYETFKQQLFAVEIKFKTKNNLSYLNNQIIKYNPKLKFNKV